jgi:hypothetical protein
MRIGIRRRTEYARPYAYQTSEGINKREEKRREIQRKKKEEERRRRRKKKKTGLGLGFRGV